MTERLEGRDVRKAAILLVGTGLYKQMNKQIHRQTDKKDKKAADKVNRHPHKHSFFLHSPARTVHPSIIHRPSTTNSQ